MTIGLSGLSPRGPVKKVVIPAEGCPSMGEERDVTKGMGVRALVNVGLVVSTACMASTREARGIGYEGVGSAARIACISEADGVWMTWEGSG